MLHLIPFLLQRLPKSTCKGRAEEAADLVDLMLAWPLQHSRRQPRAPVHHAPFPGEGDKLFGLTPTRGKLYSQEWAGLAAGGQTFLFGAPGKICSDHRGVNALASARIMISDPVGLHARPAALFVQRAKKYAGAVIIRHGDKQADAKSILQVMSLGARSGETIVVEVEDGPDAEQLLRDLAATVGHIAEEG